MMTQPTPHPTPLTLLALTGRIGSGKSHAARHLVEHLGYRHMSFAGPLKEAVAAIFGWSPEMLQGADEASRAERERVDGFWSDAFGRPMSPRRVLQEFGTEAVRAWQGNVWVKAMERRIRATGGRIVIDDCRFDNEAEMVRSLGGTVLRVEPAGATEPASVAHASEAGVADAFISRVLVNHGDSSFERELTHLVG